MEVDDKAALVLKLDPKKKTPAEISDVLIGIATDHLMTLSAEVSMSIYAQIVCHIFLHNKIIGSKCSD